MPNKRTAGYVVVDSKGRALTFFRKYGGYRYFAETGATIFAFDKYETARKTIYEHNRSLNDLLTEAEKNGQKGSEYWNRLLEISSLSIKRLTEPY